MSTSGVVAAMGLLWIPILCCLVLLAVVTTFYIRWVRSVKGERYTDRAKLRIDLYKSSIETVALLGVASSAVVAMLTFTQQVDKAASEATSDRRKQNSEQFLVAVNLLKEGTLGSTVGAIVVLDAVVESDAKSFQLPSRKVLQAALYEMQGGRDSTENILDLSTGNNVQRYQRLLEAYIRKHGSAASGCGNAGAERVDLRFLRVIGLPFPGVRGFCLDFTGASLRKADFSKSVLTAIFDRSDLTDATFQDADLQGSRFTQADLRNVTFTLSNLTRVDLSGANLNGAYLQGVESLQCANLRAVTGREAKVTIEILIDAQVFPETEQLGLVSYQQILERRKDLKLPPLRCD